VKRAELRDIERLRALRVRPAADPSVAANIEALSNSVAAEQRSIRRAESMMQAHEPALSALPDVLRGACAGTQLSRGTLTIRANHAAASHALAAWLRSGGEAALCRAVSGVKRVKVRVG
jgi:hypothetical protein